MKRIVLAVTALMLLTAGLSYSKSLTGIGLAFNWHGNMYGPALSLKFGKFPILNIGWNFANGIDIGASVDWWIANDRLIGALNYYLGVGGYGGIWIYNSSFNARIGGRLPVVGLQLWAIPNFEIFLEGALGIALLPAIDFGPQLAAGFRVHF